MATERVAVAPWIALIAVGLSACGGGGSSSDSGSDGTGATAACSSVTWSTTETAALGPVELTGISGTLADKVNDPEAALYAEARVAGRPGEEFLPLPLFVDEEASDLTLSMTAPINTEDVTRQESFDVKLVAGDVTCQARTLDVAGIEPPPEGADPVGDYVAAVEDVLVRKASSYGYANYDQLLDRRDELLDTAEPGLPPQGMLSVLLSVDALEAFRDAANAEDADRELLEAYMAHVGFPESMRDYRDALNALGPPPQETSAARAPGSSSTDKRVAYSLDPERDITASANGACTVLQTDPLSIENEEVLHARMEERAAADEALSGASGAARQTATLGLPALGLIGAAAGAVAGPVATAVGLGLFLESSLKKHRKDTYPSELTDLGFGLDPGQGIPEDYEAAGERPYWTGAELTAKSQGHDLTATVLDAASQLVSLGRFVKGVDAPDSAVDTVNDVLQNDVFNRFKELADAGEGEDGDCLTIPEQEWEVELVQLVESEVIGDALSKDGPYNSSLRRQYLTLDRIGSAEVRVSTPDDKFPGQDIEEGKFVDVVKQRVSWSPAAEHVDNLGNEFDYTVTVNNTARDVDPDVESHLPAGVAIVSGPTREGSSPFFADYSVTLQSPGSEEDYPATIVASRDAVLEPGDARTGDTRMITEQDVTITPAQACIQPDETQTLTAEVLGFGEGDELEWTVTSGPGNISPGSTEGTTRTAEVTPTADEGDIVVEAVAPAGDDNNSDTARITVGSCDAPLHVTGAGAFDGDFDASYNGTLPTPPLAPERPDSYWQGRIETLGSSENGSGYLFPFDGSYPDIDDSYEGILASATSSGETRFSTDANGGLNYRHNVETLADECHANPYPDRLQGDVDCTQAASAGLAQARYYIDHAAAATYEIVVEGECDSSGDAYAGAFVIITGRRFTGEAPESGGPLNGPFLDYPDYEGGDFIPPTDVGISAQDAENVCGPAHGGTFSFSQALDVGEPVEEDKSDLVHFTVSVSSVVGLNHYPAFDPEEYLQSGGAGSIQLTNLPDTPTTGDYTGSADIEFDVLVRQQ